MLSDKLLIRLKVKPIRMQINYNLQKEDLYLLFNCTQKYTSQPDSVTCAMSALLLSMYRIKYCAKKCVA